MKKYLPIGTLAFFLAWIGVMLAASLLKPPAKEIPLELRAVMRPEPVPLLPFSLTDQQQRPFTQADLKGRWSFLFFGYTWCPDICPTTLATLTRMTEQLYDEGIDPEDVSIIFVSVDPPRDTPEVLARYMAYFNEDFTGLTGEAGEIYDFARQFGVAYFREQERSRDEYLLSHTSSIFLVDPQARLLAAFSPPHDPAVIASLFTQIKDLFLK